MKAKVIDSNHAKYGWVAPVVEKKDMQYKLKFDDGSAQWFTHVQLRTGVGV